jgi:hypothetical protein
VAVASRAALALFVACAVVAQLANPDVGPARHMVSELAHGTAGWVMTAGFGCWAVALVLGAIVLPRADRPAGATLVAIAAAGVVVLMVFPTQTIGGELPAGVARTTAGRLHDVGSGVATLALAAAAGISGVRAWRGGDRRTSAMVVVLLAVAIAATVVGLAIGPSVGGLRQRVLLLAAVTWQWLVVDES